MHHIHGDLNTIMHLIASRKRWFKHPSSDTMIRRRKQSSKLMLPSKDLTLAYSKDGHPIYFASKSLQDAECGYVTIELEALAVAWVMKKFHHFLYASHFTLETDQKLLETILAKSLTEATPRLQWLLICTFPYNFTVRYIKGSTNQLADCLSRLGWQKDKIQLLKLKIHAITRQLPATADGLN